MKIVTKSKTITDNLEAKSFIEKYGLYADFWQPESADMSITDPLIRYKNQIQKLKEKFGYKSADVVELNPNTPNLDGILKKFVSVHHHTDDEVRFTILGEGIFGIDPLTDPTFEIYVQPGDLLVVPANTMHWFDLTEEKTIKCIRVFKDNPKWEAIYERPSVTVKG
jgi:1,2-dihydroxy-3-keto-5-methylthiopentene dioxygenase